jgi:NAD(P)-dependent dehydrogenase (short-subunit alcohol dehydrogenase family)
MEWVADPRGTDTVEGLTMMGKLQGKLAVVSGGTTGIGFAIAKRFVDEGAYVFITGRRQKELDEAVKAIGHNVAGVRGDLSQLQDLDRLYETVKAKGNIDVLVANAGVGEFAPLASLTEEHFDRLFDLNVKGTLFTVQKALPLMNDGSSIILVGSVASVKGSASFGTYGATKAAVRNLVRAWTIELKDRHIRSNVLSPGPIRTPLVELQPPETIARMLATIPMGRIGEPDEVAKAAVFLASDDSSFVTGIELFVDGGRGQV